MSWGYIGGAAVAVVGGALLADDNGATGANDAAADASRQQAAIAQDQWETYKQTYQPLEKAYAADAQEYDTAANRERAAGEAAATTAEQFGKARDQLSRAPGLDPSSAAYTSSLAGLDMREAAASAVGQNAARNRVKDMGWARRTDALSLGKGLAATASAGLSSVASADAARAQAGQAQANQQGAQIGQLVSHGVNAWNKSPSTSPGLSYTPDSDYGTGTGGRADDFSANMQEFGI